jgi:hypothetical protein
MTGGGELRNTDRRSDNMPFRCPVMQSDFCVPGDEGEVLSGWPCELDKGLLAVFGNHF